MGAVAEFQDQNIKKSDLKKFWSKYMPNEPASSGDVYKYHVTKGGQAPGKYGSGEGSLDTQYIMGVAPGVLTEFWFYQSGSFCGCLQDWTSEILSNDDVPNVFSVSYGVQGNLSKEGCRDEQIQDIDSNFAKIAAKGITLIISSGDDGSGYFKFPEPVLYPSWPASSPWVTAVGATRFQGQQVGNDEQASDQFGSGGGFSPMFDAFDDQKAAVANYLKVAKGLPPSGGYPAGGRATPDVAGLGEGFQILVNGKTYSEGGTSASAPLFAALVSLLNDARLQSGKPPMGYLNPWLYQNPNAFTDITVGNNSLDETASHLEWGFQCEKGWDPVTGLGTPIFSKMLAAAMTDASEIVIV